MAKAKTPSTKKTAAAKKEKAPAKAVNPLPPTPAPKGAGPDGPALVIVESPAKEKTITKFLGKNFTVKSSYGHVRDLPARQLGVDEKTFEPTYEPLVRTKKIMPELKRLAAAASTIYLATDHDREGESIAWHLAVLLDPKSRKVRRITFHEITPGAIKEALASPRDIDMRLVQAQQARRVLDRLVGYKLSPLLWQKVKKGLSAGRVQSVAVRILVERKKEIEAFKSEPYWSLEPRFQKPGTPPPFNARLVTYKGEKVESTQTYKLFAEDYRVKKTIFSTVDSAEAAASALRPGPFKVTSVEKKEISRRPLPPHTTSTLQQEASRKLGFPADRTMRTAQTLYEGVNIGGEGTVGLITYMRTDSVNVAKVAQEEASKFIKRQYGDDYAPAEPPVYQTKSRGAQEAHEAIRPTSAYHTPDEIKHFLTPEQQKVYELIWKRFMASQMAPARFDQVSIDIEGGAPPQGVFRATGRTLLFDGYLKVYQTRDTDEEEAEDKSEDESRLPPLAEGDVLECLDLKLEEHSTTPPPSYNEASLIRALEAHGIGRPSTYAPTVKTIIDRGYCRAEGRERKLTPTDLGVLVTEKLTGHFPEVIDLPYTASIEESLDQVAEGAQPWDKVVREFYGDFARDLKAASKTMEVTRLKPVLSDEKCPVCGKDMYVRESRFGKYLSCSDFPNCKGKISLSATGEKLKPIETNETCEKCGKPMVIRSGRRGRFMACSGYPECRNTFSVDAEGKKIIKEGSGVYPVMTARKCEKSEHNMFLRLGKRGHFVTCSGFPRCRNLKPVSREEAKKLLREAEGTLRGAGKTAEADGISKELGRLESEA